MKALVLAAGMSSRIAAVSDGLPKPLLSVGGRRVIARTLDWLASSGIADVWINLHYRPDVIREAIGDGSQFGLRIRYSHEPELLGTAGAFRALRDHWDATTLVVYGDNLMRFDLGAFVDAHHAGGRDATLALFDPDVHLNSRIAGGRVIVDDHGVVRSFVEGGGSQDGRLVNAGAYCLEPAVAREIADGFSDFGRDVFPGMVAAQRLQGYAIERSGYCIGLDTPESFRAAEALISSQQLALA